MPKNPQVGVKYIGRRPSFHDRLFGTGLDFSAGQTRFIPADIARKFLKHASEFEQDDGKVSTKAKAKAADDTDDLLDQAKAKQDQANKELDELQYLRDQVTRMEKPELQAIAKTKYGQELDGRTSVQNMRDQVVSLMDRFGAV